MYKDTILFKKFLLSHLNYQLNYSDKVCAVLYISGSQPQQEQYCLPGGARRD